MPKKPGDEDGDRGVDFGWRAHSAQEGWTAKVDAKAAIFFTVQLALNAALLSGYGKGHVIDRLDANWLILAEIGTVLFLSSTVFTGATVVPLLGRSKEHLAQHHDHLVYFGHLRHWSAPALAQRLAELTAEEELDQLARQLVEMSRRNWKKHRCLQTAIAFALPGYAMVGLSIIAG